ncbi:MAG: hypothetical protein C0524_06095 [Rhodobacter sp.]|nr:hypothetical protein [Rhodobacter sp.]
MSQIRLLQVHGPASAAGTVLGTQNPTETGTWAEVTGLGTIPPGGAMLDISANAGAIRFAVMPPNTIATPPPHNGEIVQNGAARRQHIPTGSRVWTRLT